MFVCRFILVGVLFASPLFASGQEEAFRVEVRTVSGMASVPAGAQRVGLLGLAFHAPCDRDVTVRRLILRHDGRGDVADLERIYAMENGVRVSRTASVAQDAKRLLLRFPLLRIPACRTRNLTIAADFSADAAIGSEHRLSLRTEGDVDAGGTAVTLSGNSSQWLRTVAGTVGTVEVEVLPLRSSVRYGNGRTVARFVLRVDGDADQRIVSLTVTNDGTARGEHLQNIVAIATDGTRLSRPVASLSGDEGDQAVLAFDPPLEIGRNEERIIVLKADVRGRKRHTIRLLVEEPGDILALPSRGRSR